MKSFKQIVEEAVLNEGGEMYPADDMTMKELKIACYAAQNILDRLEDGAMLQRWQISAIVKAKEELASVYTSMSADEDDDEEWEDEEDPMYVGYEYPSMYGEEAELDESYQELSTLKTRIARNTKKMKSLPDLHPEKKKLTIAVAKDTKNHDDLFKRQFKNEEAEIDEGYNDPEYIRRAIPALKNAVEFHKDMMKDHDKKSVKGSTEYVKAHSAAANAHKEAAERHRIAHAQLSVGSKDVEYYVKPARELGAHAEKLSDKANRLKEEVDYAVDIEGLPKMYVKGDSPAQVKANLRKIIKKPDMIQSVDRVTQSMLKKIFRDKATGKDEVAEEVELDEVSKNTLKSYISKKSQQIIDKDDKSDPYGINSGGSSKERNKDFDKLNLARRKLKD